MPGIDPGDIAVCIPIVALMIPIVSIWTKHQQRMALIKARVGTARMETAHMQNSAAEGDIAQAMNSLQREVSALRETTTRFDMSFDAALSRLESRVDQIEAAPAAVPVSTEYMSAPPAAAAVEPLVLGRAPGDR